MKTTMIWITMMIMNDNNDHCTCHLMMLTWYNKYANNKNCLVQIGNTHADQHTVYYSTAALRFFENWAPGH